MDSAGSVEAFGVSNTVMFVWISKQLMCCSLHESQKGKMSYVTLSSFGKLTERYKYQPKDYSIQSDTTNALLSINMATCFGSMNHHRANSQTIWKVHSVDVHIVGTQMFTNRMAITALPVDAMGLSLTCLDVRRCDLVGELLTHHFACSQNCVVTTLQALSLLLKNRLIPMWNKKPTRCHLVLYLFLRYKLLNMFRATLCPSSGAEDLVVFLPRVV